MHNLALAHSAAYRAIKQNTPSGSEVGVSVCGRLCYPSVDTPENREAAYRASFDLNGKASDWTFTFNIFLDSLMFHHYDEDAPEKFKLFAETIPAEEWMKMERPDFIGVNVYQGVCVDGYGRRTDRYSGIPLTAGKWFVTPQVMRYGINNLFRRYGLPMIITENGQACNDRVFLDGKVHDPNRIDFLHRYLLELRKAIDDGTPVKGYLHWSFMDNFEWAEGYDDRFGFVYVDYRTQERIPKDSAFWYTEVIRTNGKEL